MYRFSRDERLIFSGGMDNTLRYWNTRGDLKYENNQFRGWVSCILNMQGKQDYIAIGSWDGSVKILNSEYNAFKDIPGEEYAVTSLSCDEDGDFYSLLTKMVLLKLLTLVKKENLITKSNKP